MIKAIIFDLGNVIVKVDKTEQYKKFSANSDKTVSYIKKYFDNSPIRKFFEKGRLNSNQFYNEITKELNLKIDFNNFRKIWCDIFTLNEDVENIIKCLKKNFKLILLSNTDVLHFKYLKDNCKIINYFDDCILSYKVGYRKPNPLIYLSALRKAKTLPFNCIYIDDIPNFVYVARLMGINAFKYKNFKKLMSDLNSAKLLIKN